MRKFFMMLLVVAIVVAPVAAEIGGYPKSEDGNYVPDDSTSAPGATAPKTGNFSPQQNGDPELPKNAGGGVKLPAKVTPPSGSVVEPKGKEKPPRKDKGGIGLQGLTGQRGLGGPQGPEGPPGKDATLPSGSAPDWGVGEVDEALGEGGLLDGRTLNSTSQSDEWEAFATRTELAAGLNRTRRWAQGTFGSNGPASVPDEDIPAPEPEEDVNVMNTALIVMGFLLIGTVLTYVIWSLVLRGGENANATSGVRTVADPAAAGETGAHRGEIKAPDAGACVTPSTVSGYRYTGPNGTISGESWSSTPAAVPASPLTELAGQVRDLDTLRGNLGSGQQLVASTPQAPQAPASDTAMLIALLGQQQPAAERAEVEEPGGNGASAEGDAPPTEEPPVEEATEGEGNGS